MCKEKTEFWRLCPECNEQIIYYKYEKSRDVAIVKNTICRKCKIPGMLGKHHTEKTKTKLRGKRNMDVETQFARQCPKCNKNIFYKSEEKLNRANKNNSECFKCNNLHRNKKTEFWRKCPDENCNEIKYYKTQKHLDIANRKNSKCSKCAHKKKITEFWRKCPNPKSNPRCKGIMYYTTLNRLIAATKRNSKCHSCSHSGENHYMFGKTYEEAFGKELAEAKKEKQRSAISGENHYMQGKSQKEYFGEEEAKRLSDLNSVAHKGERNCLFGTTFDEYHGIEEANKIRDKLSKANSNPSEETRRRKRVAAIKVIKEQKENNGQVQPRYNHNGCLYLEWIIEQSGTHIMHAENGGEFELKELGYFADGYDPENNIWYEIDELHHYRSGKLREKDIRRQKEITEYLGCYFVRIKAFNFEASSTAA